MSLVTVSAASPKAYTGWQSSSSPQVGNGAGSPRFFNGTPPQVTNRAMSPSPRGLNNVGPRIGRFSVGGSVSTAVGGGSVRFSPPPVHATPSNLAGSSIKVGVAGYSTPPAPQGFPRLGSVPVRSHWQRHSSPPPVSVTRNAHPPAQFKEPATIYPGVSKDSNKPPVLAATPNARIQRTTIPKACKPSPMVQTRSVHEPSKLPIKTSRTNNTPMLRAVGRDLTKSAADGALDPLIGREAEIEQIVQALARRRKNNPVLVGDPGVGKTAVVEGLAQKIATGTVPDVLREKRIVQLDVATLLAGAQNRGEFEERMKLVVEETLASKKQIILFIDEIHTIVGAGRSSKGGNSVDAAAILKPVLARGDIQCIGITTLEEYRAHIEKDSSLERRFQVIPVEQTSIGETLQILEGLAPKYEAHHQVKYSPEAFTACVKLAAEHIPDRSMPDKAIDVFDEVGAFVQLRHGSSQEKVQEPDVVREIRQRLLAVQKEKELAVHAEQYALASQLNVREKSLQTEIKELLAGVESDETASDDEPIVVTEDDVAKVISKMTGIPLQKLTDDESVRMQQLEEVLHNRIIGQDQAVVSVAKALRRARVGLKSPNRPIASFLFCGPTGVGKTELCKALSQAYFGKEDAMIRLDMSEFLERHSVSKLIGSPAGYIGYGDENQLTDRIRRKPYALILFDEIEKAHADVLNLMLQIMDDGCLTDATGRRVSFKNALIIMTSNVSPRDSDLRQNFTPEFLNRLDEIIPFSHLSKTEVADIAELELAKTVERVKERGASLTMSAAFKDEIVEQGFDAAYGARPLRRSVRQMLDDALANSLLEQPFVEGEHVHVDVDEGRQVVVVREDPEKLSGESGQSDSEDTNADAVNEHVVDTPESDSVIADTESTKDSECSDKATLKDSKPQTPPARKPLSDLSLSRCLSAPLYNLKAHVSGISRN